MNAVITSLLFLSWTAWVFWLGRMSASNLPTDADFEINLPPPPEGLGEFAWRRNGKLPQP